MSLYRKSKRDNRDRKGIPNQKKELQKICLINCAEWVAIIWTVFIEDNGTGICIDGRLLNPQNFPLREDLGGYIFLNR